MILIFLVIIISKWRHQHINIAISTLLLSQIPWCAFTWEWYLSVAIVDIVHFVKVQLEIGLRVLGSSRRFFCFWNEGDAGDGGVAHHEHEAVDCGAFVNSIHWMWIRNTFLIPISKVNLSSRLTTFISIFFIFTFVKEAITHCNYNQNTDCTS